MPVPPPHWMLPASGASLEDEGSSPIPSARADLGEGLLPRQLTDHGTLGFRAKLSIPHSEEPLDETWRERHLDDRRRMQSLKQLDRAADQFFDSKAYRILRTGLLVATGGLCAGLAIYLQDRNWVLDLPWRPGPAESFVITPAAVPAARTRALEAADPFILEDPSELEAVSIRPAFLPVPEAQSLPVGGAPIAAARK